jgi:hypothetical protein
MFWSEKFWSPCTTNDWNMPHCSTACSTRVGDTSRVALGAGLRGTNRLFWAPERDAESFDDFEEGSGVFADCLYLF